ncbi:hypothetical protein GYA54_03895 [Candidatus Kuenenbacteria bacterium]|nr:hypothetical protein [Candidatus Kuenenbacteria bacterium]
MKNQLDKIIYFVKNTGDKVIVLKDDSEFVVMPLDEYEGLFRHKKAVSEMTEEEILSRVNREIALWRESQKNISEAEDKDYFKRKQLADDDFYYRGTKDFETDDNWVEPDWQDDELEDLKDDSSPLYPVEEDDFDFQEDENFDPGVDYPENKKGAEDVSLPLNNRPENFVPKSEPITRPKTKINNFGYSNPIDTGEVSGTYGDNFEHIPPPPNR